MKPGGRVGGFARSLAAFAVVASSSSWSGAARADGGVPRGYGILFEPGNPSHIVVHSQFWGLFDGNVGSSAFRLLCSQVFGGRATDADNYPTAVAHGGRLMVASGFDGLRISDDGCEWKTVDAFNGEPVGAIARADAGGTSFVAVTVKNENGPVISRAYASGDRGDHWTQLKGAIQTNVSIANVAVAPSDPKRIYAVGVVTNYGPRMIAVSKDGGATFAMLPIGAMTDYDPMLLMPLSVAGIVPDAPDVLFVRADGSDTSGSSQPDELWVSSDAGQSWKKAYKPIMDLPGFAFTPDGKSVLVAGPTEGIKQAPLADAVAGNAGAFVQIYQGQVWGLTFQGSDLYAGNDDFAMKPPFTVGVSKDGGRTFQQVMSRCDVSLPSCGDASTSERMCREQWTRLGGYVTDILASCTNGGAGGVAGSSGAPGSSGASASGGASSNDGSRGGGGVSGAAPETGSDDQRTRTQTSSSCSVGARSRRGLGLTMIVAATAALAVRIARRRRD